MTVDTLDSWQLKLVRPYLVAVRIEKGIKFIFLHEPLKFMCSLLAESEIVEADVT